jgi:hypothetical protein
MSAVATLWDSGAVVLTGYTTATRPALDSLAVSASPPPGLGACDVPVCRGIYELPIAVWHDISDAPRPVHAATRVEGPSCSAPDRTSVRAG